MVIKMKKQQCPQRSCKVIKKHVCSEHLATKSGADERPKSGTKSGSSISKSFCPCNPCLCDVCPDVLQLVNRPFSNKGIEAFEDLSFGLCPKAPDAKPASCSKTCTEIARPKPIKLDMITYDDECTCELIARAIRADVHRYLSLVDRTPKPKPCPACISNSNPKPNLKSDFKACPESMAKPKCNLKTCPDCVAESIPKSIPKPNLKSDLNDCPECLDDSNPYMRPKSKIKFCDSDVDRDLPPCLEPDAKL